MERIGSGNNDEGVVAVAVVVVKTEEEVAAGGGGGMSSCCCCWSSNINATSSFALGSLSVDFVRDGDSSVCVFGLWMF